MTEHTAVLNTMAGQDTVAKPPIEQLLSAALETIII